MLILFDLDGTLTDPYDGITRSVVHALDALDWPAPGEAALRAFIGPPLQDGFASLGLPADRVGAAVAAYRERFANIGWRENRVYDGIPQALEELRERGAAMAVATSKPTVFAEQILEHFDLARHFRFVAGATLDGIRRHKVDVIQLALTELAHDASSPTVMVGDRAQDVVGAEASGMSAIGVRWGYAEVGELEAAGASTIVAAPTELPDAVAALVDAG